MTKKRPHVVLKMAMTLDGKIAATGGESKWISSDASRRLVHKLRTESDAVLVGANTANRDNPQLTSHGAGRNPIRIILDPNLKTKSNLRVYTDKKAQTMLVTPYGSLKASSLKKKGVKILRANLRFGKIEVKDLLNNLFKMNVSQLLVEGGGETAWNFIESGFVDELYFFIAPKILGGRTAVTPVEGQGFGRIRQAFKLRNMSVSRSGEDILVHAFTSRH